VYRSGVGSLCRPYQHSAAKTKIVVSANYLATTTERVTMLVQRM